MTAEYSEAVHQHSFSIRFFPQHKQRKKITDLNIEIDGCQSFVVTDDSFQNKKCYGRIAEPHRNFALHIRGKAETGLAIYEEYTDYPFSAILFKTQTDLTKPGKNLLNYHQALGLHKWEGSYDKALYIMRAIPDVFSYHPGTTEVHETAENAFTLGKGVCQDYAHIMLSLLREEHIPARYVVGMMLGEGASHAWVEALCGNYWYGFDPTNNQLVNDEYIRVSCGRDSDDCSIIRGRFYGCGIQQQNESVIVEEIKERIDSYGSDNCVHWSADRRNT